MFDIAKYLEKFKVMSCSRDFLRNSVSESIKNICGVEIDPKKIDIKDGLARISERPIIKTEIFMKKEKILKSFSKEVGEKVRDIV